jgi:hypothetical protein
MVFPYFSIHADAFGRGMVVCIGAGDALSAGRFTVFGFPFFSGYLLDLTRSGLPILF